MANPGLITDVGAVAIAAGPVLTPVPAVAPSTFTVRNAALNSGVFLVDIWTKSAAVGYVQVTSPNLVPVSNGIRIQTPTGLADFLLPRDNNQALIPQDNLDVQADGTAADEYMVALQSYYENLPGGGMTLKNPGDISGVTDFVFGWPCHAAASATVGGLGSTVVTSTVDSSTANTWYAVLGYQVDVSVGAVGISGVDTSQLFIGGPGDTAGAHTHRYFEELSVATGQPCIPLFNAANKANTNVIVADSAASTAVNVTLVLAQLRSSYTP